MDTTSRINGQQHLPSIAEACPDLPVMIDGGIRRGSDVLKALALGARAVFVGKQLARAVVDARLSV